MRSKPGQPRLPLVDYIRLARNASGVEFTTYSHGELFPCPPPFSFDQEKYSKKSRRAQRRWSERRGKELWTNLSVLALSHRALNGVRSCPAGGRAGAGLNKAQLEMVEMLWRMKGSMCRLADPSASCGATLSTASDRLDAVAERLACMNVVPYGRSRAGARRSH